MRYILTLLFTVALAVPAFAMSSTLIDSRANPTDTTLTGIITPASAVNNMDDPSDNAQNRNVIMQGRLVKSGTTGNNYVLEDNTGNVAVQIDEHVIGNYKFDTNNMVRVRGNIVRELGGQIKVNADAVELMR